MAAYYGLDSLYTSTGAAAALYGSPSWSSLNGLGYRSSLAGYPYYSALAGASPYVAPYAASLYRGASAAVAPFYGGAAAAVAPLYDSAAVAPLRGSAATPFAYPWSSQDYPYASSRYLL
jgi:hypothetical protein